jgi:hypothetical protein
MEMCQKISRIEFEITNYCNAKCIFCPRFNIKNFGVMDLKMFKKFILQIKEKTSITRQKNFDKFHSFPMIVFGGYGEALLHPNIYEFIDYAKKNNFKTELITNGLLLNKKNCIILEKAGIDKISISLHTLNPVINAKITGLNNVIPIVKRALLYFESKNTEIEIWRVANLDGKNFSENPKDNDYNSFLAPFKKKILVLGPTPAWNRGGQYDSKFYPIIKDSQEIRCKLMLHTLNISYNGDMVLCCCDFSRKSCILTSRWKFDRKKIQNKLRYYQKNPPLICINCRRPKADVSESDSIHELVKFSNS